MKKSKLLIVCSLIMLVVLVLSACSPAAQTPAAEKTEEPMTAATEEMAQEEVTEEVVAAKMPFIPMVQHSAIPYTEQMKVGYDAACEDLPIECEYSAPETINIEAEIGMFESMLQKGADAIILNPASPEAWTEVIKTATDEGVIVNSLDNVADAASGFNVYVAPDTKATAVSLAETYFAILAEKGVTEGQVVWSICAPGYTGQELRADGWEEVCDNQNGTNFECIGPLDSGQSVELDYAFWETTVLQYPDAVGFAGNCAFDGPNLAKIRTLNNADWGIATFDLEPETLEYIQDGVIDVAMGINPWLNAYLATALAYDSIVNNKPLPQNYQIRLRS